VPNLTDVGTCSFCFVTVFTPPVDCGYPREDLLQRDKASLDLFWLRDASMTDLENLPEPDVLAEEILEHLGAAMESFNSVVQDRS